MTSCHMLEAAGRQGGSSLVKVRATLRQMVGDVDAEAMLTGVTASHELASLGLLTGLARLAQRRDHRDEFARRYGHRGPHEFELSIPRPGEDPGWIDAPARGPARPERRRDRAARAPGRRRATRRGRASPQRTRARTRRMRERVRRWGAVVRDRETAQVGEHPGVLGAARLRRQGRGADRRRRRRLLPPPRRAPGSAARRQGGVGRGAGPAGDLRAATRRCRRIRR